MENTRQQTTGRIVGYDVARAVAVVGMVLVNFKIAMGAEKAGPDWLVWLAGLFDGRAAATFVVLAGVGLSLMAHKACQSGDPILLGRVRATLFKRAGFLLGAGLAYATVWPADILHFYGLYIAIGAVLLTVADQWLWRWALVLNGLFLVLLGLFDYEVGWNWETLEYSGFWTAEGLVRHLFFNGFHPVIPWVGFLLVGMWLGRQAVGDARWRRRTFISALGALALTEAVSWGLVQWLLSGNYALGAEDVQALFGTTPMPPMPLYMIAGSATAIALILLCIELVQRWPTARWVAPLESMGQLALTLYVAHVILGMGILQALGRLEDQGLVFACASALAFSLVALLFAHSWRQRFGQGPLEWVMRRVTL